MAHVVAERDVHVATFELTGQAAAVERRDRVCTVERHALSTTFNKKKLHLTKSSTSVKSEAYLYKCRVLGSSSVLRKYLEKQGRLLH